MRQNVYRIEWLAKAAKQFHKIKDEKLKVRIIQIIEEDIACNPLIGKPLNFDFEGTRSYRLGNLRILYRPYKTKLIIVIIRIDHRKNVYRLH